MQITNEELEAIISLDKNLLISAAAGSGKTFVLVERIIKLLEDDSCDINEILVMTFTNAAAQEMKSRIHSKLLKRMRSEICVKKRNRLEKQLVLISSAQITTIHSFCQSILRNNFSRIDIEAMFRVATEEELSILKNEVIEELFEKNYQAGGSVFKKFTDEFGGNIIGDRNVYDIIYELYEFSLSMSRPNQWLDSLPRAYESCNIKTLANNSWFKFLNMYVQETLQKIFEECLKAKILMEENHFDVKAIKKDFDQLNDLKSFLNDWNKLNESIHQITFERYSAPKGTLPEIKFLRDSYKHKIEKLKDNYLIGSKEKMICDLHELFESVCELVRVTKEFAKEFAKAKRERGIIDFSDMEHLTLKIFNEAPEVVAAYRKKFKFIMIDEYQDTNETQDEIIQKISRPNNLFLVGDSKQSIYRFRLVDSKNFREKLGSYHCINLSKNFRSRRQIINTINEIFKRLMNYQKTEIKYDEDAQLQFGANYLDGDKYLDELPEMFVIKLERELSDDNKSIDLEMRLIANRIHKLIDSKKIICEENNYRPIQLKDIVILHRSPRGQALEILNALKRYGIPAYIPSDENYFQTIEIQVMLNLLKLLNNARQDIPLAVVMSSPIGNFNAEELAEIRIKNPKDDFYDAVYNGNNKCKNFLSMICRWRENARSFNVSELLSRIYHETGYYDFVGREMDNGKIRQANLRILIDHARNLEKTNKVGLSRFVEYLEKLQALGKNLRTVSVFNESENVVRIITIHKSKGLEYPVVFVAGLGKNFNTEDYVQKNVFMHKELGIGVYRSFKRPQVKVRTLATQAISRRIKNESLAEELRILYVALTRAKEKLFLVGTCSETTLKKSRFTKQLGDYEILSARKYLDWLLPISDNLERFVDIKIIPQSEILKFEGQSVVIEKRTKAPKAPEKLPAALVYQIPAKLSVTELNRMTEESELTKLEDVLNKRNFSQFIYKRPAFLQAEKITGFEFGSLIHRIMQRLNFKGDLSSDGVRAQLKKLIQQGIILAEQTKNINVAKIANFFSSDIGQEIRNSPEVHRELLFNRFVSAKIFFGVDEKIFIQGMIDLIFKDTSNKWILLDYKTDKNTEGIRERYKIQIELYTQALEDLLRINVDKKYLYTFSDEKFVRM